ncbi:MAG: hypothetical protein H7338_04830 [Candidatus Sericytochromatia bacterium]|nr:hypothetical protein [Candidatus Sericytochromatia bacterium]
MTGTLKLAIPAVVMVTLMTLSGCGRIPVGIQQAVSPCIELPRALAFDGKTILTTMLELDFKQKDANSDGVVTLSEAQAKATKPNLIDEKLFRAIGIKDGKLPKDALRKAGAMLTDWAQHYKNLLHERYDKNNDHGLVYEEVQGLFGIDAATFATADEVKTGTAGDGKLNADEFLGLVLHMNETTSDCGGVAAAGVTRRTGLTTRL